MDGTGGQQQLRNLSSAQLRERHPGPLNVIWDNAPAHSGKAVREYLGTPGLGLRLVNLPGYSSDINADETIWLGERGGDRKPVLGEQGGCSGEGRQFPRWTGQPEDEVQRRCRTILSRGPRHSCETRGPVPGTAQMHIPPWLWFRFNVYRQLSAVKKEGAGRFPSLLFALLVRKVSP